MTDEAVSNGLFLSRQADFNARRIAHLTACLVSSNAELARLRAAAGATSSRESHVLNIPESRWGQSRSSAASSDLFAGNSPAPHRNAEASTPSLRPPSHMLESSLPFGIRSGSLSTLCSLSAKRKPRSLRPVPSMIDKPSKPTYPAARPPTSSRRWTPDEQERFAAAHVLHGSAWSALSTPVGPRTSKQVRAYSLRLQRRKERRSPGVASAVDSLSIAVMKSAPSPLQSLSLSLPTSPLTPRPLGLSSRSELVESEASSPFSLGCAIEGGEKSLAGDPMDPISSLAPVASSVISSRLSNSFPASALRDRPSLVDKNCGDVLETPFGTFPGVSLCEKDIDWEELRDMEPLSLSKDVLEPFEDILC